VTPDTWAHVAFKIKVHSSAGTLTIYVNGSVVLTLTGLNTRGSASDDQTDLVMYGYFNNVAACYFDDFIITDSVTVDDDDRNGYLGDVIGERVALVGDGASSQWTRNSGATNASCVDDTLQDGDATIVTADTVGRLDLYTVAAPVRIANPLQFLQITTVGKKDTGGTRAIAHAVRSAGANHIQADRYLSTSYAAQVTRLVTNPETSAAFLMSELGPTGIQVGQKVTV
jgi:hypothetical protein